MIGSSTSLAVIGSHALLKPIKVEFYNAMYSHWATESICEHVSVIQQVLFVSTK